MTLKRSLLLTCVLCVFVAGVAHADELADLRAQNAQLKAENAQLKQRIAQLEQTNTKILAQAKQDKQQKHAMYLNIQPNEQGGKTITSYVRPMPLTVGKKRHCTYDLQAQKGGSQITMTIFAGLSPGMFRTAKQMKLDIDGKSLDLPIANYDSKRRRSSASSRNGVTLYDETLQIRLTPQLVSQIATANQVTGKLGIAEFALGREDYNLFGVLAEALK